MKDMTMELRNEPVQKRSTARLSAIEAAAEQAIAEEGIDRFTTGDVARIAGCSIGTVYRYFPDRVAILDRLRPNRHAAAAVLELHKPDTDEHCRPWDCVEGDCEHDEEWLQEHGLEECPFITVTYCAECAGLVQQVGYEGYPVSSSWPCATARALGVTV